MRGREAEPIDGQDPVPSLLKISGLSKTFPGVVALDRVSFDVGLGEIHALLGANGAGKSTLIKIVSGLYRPNSGQIELGGRVLDLKDTQAAMEAGIGVIYQEFSLVPDLTVAENLFLGSERVNKIGLVDWQRTQHEAQALLSRVGANFPPSARVRDLGAGQKQLVDIAKALRAKVRLLILDEPTASLSQGEAERLFMLIRSLAKTGVGIVYVTHRLEEIAPLVDRVTILRDGRSVGTFPANRLDRKAIVKLIAGEERQVPSRPDLVEISAPPLLELKKLTRSGEFSDVSLMVRGGEILVITGLVGAGRTEILQTLFGVQKPASGTINLAGRPVVFRSPADAIRAGIVLVPEDRRGQGVATILPVFVNITLACLHRFVQMGRIRKKREMAHVCRMIDELGIKVDRPTASTATLSGGNQQKVVLAKWLSVDSRVFLLDEPTQGIDVGAKAEIYAIMRSLANRGCAVVVASSDIEEVLEIADRVLAMKNGRIVAEFDRATASASALVAAITHG